MMRMLPLLIALATALSPVGLVSGQGLADAYSDVPKSRTGDGGFVLGDPDATIKLIEFSDFLCGSCQNYKPAIESFIEQYVVTGQAQFEYRMFPVIDPQLSPLSSGLVECADQLQDGLFWQAHDLMFEMVIQDGFTAALGHSFAEALGLDASELQTCAANAGQYLIDSQYGFEMGVSGTPALFVQYGESSPIAIPPVSDTYFPVIVNAKRRIQEPPVVIEEGRYAGIPTFRSDDGAFVLGSPDAPLTIAVFEDFLCGHCQNYQETLHQFIEDHVRAGQATFEYRFYPLVNPPLSEYTAKIAECVGILDIGKFWQAHDLLFELAQNRQISDGSALEVADTVDVNEEALLSCLDQSIQYLVDVQLGRKTGVSGTPAIRARKGKNDLDIIHLGQQALDGGGVPFDVLSALAEEALEITIGPPEQSMLNDAYLHDLSLLTKEPCGPPCWQHIRPGQTSMDDAASIIDALDSTLVLESALQNIAFGSNDGVLCCQIFSDDGTVVSAIVLQLAPKSSLGDVIAINGEPTYVTGSVISENEALLILIFPDLQLVLNVFVGGPDGLIGGMSPVVAAIYTTPEQLQQVIASVPLDDWKGYQTASTYMDGEFDHNP